jgi:hypothetical protein
VDGAAAPSASGPGKARHDSVATPRLWWWRRRVGLGGRAAVATAAAVAAGAVAVATAVEAMAAVMGASDVWRWGGGWRGGATRAFYGTGLCQLCGETARAWH